MNAQEGIKLSEQERLPLVEENNPRQQEAIAIIGMAGMFPQAPDVMAFWRNICDGVDAIGEPLPEWEAARYLASDRIKSSRGGYLKELYRFDPKAFGIMPKSVDGGEPDQFLALKVAADALKDAGYGRDDYDHHDTGIVLGHSTYLHRGQVNHVQHHIILDQTIELVENLLPALQADQLLELRKHLEHKLPQSNADIAPGLVPNVMTGRIANRLNLKGPNYLIDAACSSSLLAVSAAVEELRSGSCRMMLAGGVNASLPAEVSVIFTQLGALSPSGKIRPFEEGCDGTLLGEGLGVIVLKRLSDALADGDRIYALIRGIGKASDGQGFGLLAPSVEGEALAIERAYASTGIDPATIELIEAHGTGIPLGDKTEMEALTQIFGKRLGKRAGIAIGSVKSMISHCIPAAGIAGLIKAALALHHKLLPPTLCEKISPDLNIENTPFYVNVSTRPWIASSGHPRRAGVNSFGFGGINTHAILEEMTDKVFSHASFVKWPFELCVFSGADTDALIEKLTLMQTLLEKNPVVSAGDIAAFLAARDAGEPFRLAVVTKDRVDLSKKIVQALKRLKKEKGGSPRWSTRNGMVYSRIPVDGKTAFMFPGEGSQYLEMLADMAMYFDEVRVWFDFWRGLYQDTPGGSRTDIVFPPKLGLTDARRRELEERLHDMDVGSEAVFIAAQAMHALLQAFGVKPDVMVGHSTGESSALAAAGAMPTDDLTQLAGFIRKLNSIYQRVLSEGKIPTGGLLSVGALKPDIVKAQIDALNANVVVAMDNCVNQLVLFGDQVSMDTLRDALGEAGGICIPLPFDRGYHTPQFAAVSAAFAEYYDHIGLRPPEIPLYSCASAALFPGEDEQGTRKLAAAQWSTTVRFRETVAAMYADGIRYFIEVGPSGNLCSFVNDILAGEEYLALASDLRQKNSLEQFLILLANLYVNKQPVKLEKLFAARRFAPVETAGRSGENTDMMLDNIMPVIHIGNADRNTLKQILGMDAPAQKQAAIPAAAVSLISSCQQDSNGAMDASLTTEDVMSGYFDLMRHFLDQQHLIMSRWQHAGNGLPDAIDRNDTRFPFINAVTFQDDRKIIAETCLSVYQDAFLKDHILSGSVSAVDPDLLGLSCVPLMVSLEIMAQACASLAGRRDVNMISNIKAFDWIALDRGEATLTVQAEMADSAAQSYHARLTNAGQPVAVADFSFGESDENHRTSAGMDELNGKHPYRWEDGELYATGMFHGPIFRSIAHIGGWNDKGIDARLTDVSLSGFFSPGHPSDMPSAQMTPGESGPEGWTHDTPDLILNPVLLDAVGQLAAFWIAQKVGTDFNSFPSTIAGIRLYGTMPRNTPGLTLSARQYTVSAVQNVADTAPVWNFECLDGQGRLVFSIDSLVNVYFPVPHRFYAFRRDPLNGWLGGPCNAFKDASRNILLWQLPHFDESFCRQSAGIFLRIMAQALLSAEEREQWLTLASTSDSEEKCRWLSGRACIKEAVRYFVMQQTGYLLFPSDIIVVHDEHGAPYVDGWWHGDLIDAPEVSLTHAGRVSITALAPSRQPVGIHAEQRKENRHYHLIREAMSRHERQLVERANPNDEMSACILRVGCAKEAAAKYLGTGFMESPETFKISSVADDWGQAHVKVADTMIRVQLIDDDDMIAALAVEESA